MTAHAPLASNRAWQTTRRSILAKAKQSDEAALSTLCTVYWQPVYRFVRAHHVDHDLAMDIAQGVFANLLRRDLCKFDLERGSRFRHWLKRVVRSHILNVLRQRRRLHTLEAPCCQGSLPESSTLNADSASQDQLFDRCTALVLIDRAWERLRLESYSEHPLLFQHLRQSLSGEPTALTDAELSARLDKCSSYVRKLRSDVKSMHFPEALRSEMRALGVSDRNLNQELRSLMEALA